MQLRIPGPTPCPPKVLEAMAKQMINHRGKEFASLSNGITEQLKKVYQTKNDVYILSGSGTGGMEAAIVNMLSPGDKVLSASNGVFGNRFADIAQTFGANVERLKFELGKPIDPDAIKKALQANPAVKAVLVTHNETSTGVTSDLQALGKVIREFDKLSIVDSISAMCSIDCPVDAWGLDVVVSGSQKGWMVPPGLAFISVSEKALKAQSAAKMPRFYWDLSKAKNMLEKGQTPWTPVVSIYYALEVSLKLILEEGLKNIFARHAAVAKKAREGAKANNLPLLADEKYASSTVTAVKGIEKLNISKLNQILRDEYKIVLSGGQGDLTGKIFRIGHLGWVTEKDIEEVWKGIAMALPKAME